MQAPDIETEQTECQSCGNLFKGNYCNNCGEKVFDAHHKKVGHLFEEAFHFITHFEGNFFTSLKTTWTRPGKFALDYSNGIRRKYFKPVSYFMLLVVLYLLFPKFEGLNMRMAPLLMEDYGYRWATLPMARAKLKSSPMEDQELVRRYDEKSPKVAKLGLFLLIPLTGLLLLAIFFYTRKYYFDHCLIAIEYLCFFIALHYLLMPLVDSIFEWIKAGSSPIRDDNDVYNWFLALSDISFAAVAFRTFYQRSWWIIIPSAVLFSYALGQVVFFVFRLIVYAVTLLII
jgi:hypothetical protein